MSNHASHAALPYPIKGARYTIYVPYLDADGDPTAPTTPDTELSEDNAAAADAAEEVTATSGMDGMGMLTFTGAETDCSLLAGNAKVASGPKATLFTLYPRVLAEVGTGTLSAGSAGGGTLGTILAYDVTGCFIKTTGGTGGGGAGGANNQARKIVTYNTGTGAFTVTPNWETTPDATTTYAVLLPEGVTLGMLRTLNPTTAGRTLDVTATGEAGIDLDNTSGALGTAQFDAAFLTAGLIATGAIDADAIAADAVTEIQSGLATAAALDVVDNLLDTEVAAIFDRIGAPAGASIAADLLVIDNFVDDLESRLTAARAGYLDNINNANLASVPAFPSNFALLGINASGHVSRVVLADTLTTYTGNTVQTGDAYGVVNSGTHGNAALKTILDTKASQASVDTVDDFLDTEMAALTTTVGALFTTALTQSYRSAGAAPTAAQCFFEILAHLGDCAIVSTTKTLNNLAGTAAKTFTLNSATTPTSITETT